MDQPRKPNIVVFSSLFPSAAQPAAGVFIQERMRHVAKSLPVMVVAPRAWFPLQSLIRLFRPGFRPMSSPFEQIAGMDVYRPLVLSVPGVFKSLDGLFMALGAYPRMSRLKKDGRLDVIDAHFAYPDGYAASLLGRWLDVPVTVTLRGTEARHAKDAKLSPLVRRALDGAARVFAVADALKRVAVGIGVPQSKVLVVGNGVDTDVFRAVDKHSARAQLGLDEDATVLITVGGLVERKGFHRVMAAMPQLLQRYPKLVYLVVGGSSPEGNWEPRLRALADELGLKDRVRFLGAMPANQLKTPLSASDLFVLSTRNEGWANVLLEAMACGLPIVTTDVGGNKEVVSGDAFGIVVPFDQAEKLTAAIHDALARTWDREAIVRYARAHSWDDRAKTLVEEFMGLRRAFERAHPAMHTGIGG